MPTAPTVRTLVTRIPGELFWWSLEPLLLSINVALALLGRVYYSVPPFRWTVCAVARVVQVFVCLQTFFLTVTFLKLAWGTVCLFLCGLIDVVEDNADRASLAAVIKRFYYLPGR